MVFPGCVVGVVHANGYRELSAHGRFTYDAHAKKVQEDTVYDLASITKSIPTASLALMLMEEGKLSLEDRLADHLPEFKNSDRDRVLIKHLLTYTIDGYGMASLKAKNANELFNILYTRDFERSPGTLFKYTNVPATLLGLALEKIYGTTLEVAAHEHFFDPLDMKRTTFFPELLNGEEVAPTEIDEWRGVVQGVVHDESAYTAKRDGKLVGHAGLFSTAGDMLAFLEMLLNRGTLHGKKYFSEETIDAMCTNQIPELGAVVGLGWELNQPRFMGVLASPRAFGRGGFTGTVCVCDIDAGSAYVILSNRTYPKRPQDISAFRKVSADIGDIVFGAYT